MVHLDRGSAAHGHVLRGHGHILGAHVRVRGVVIFIFFLIVVLIVVLIAGVIIIFFVVVVIFVPSSSRSYFLIGFRPLRPRFFSCLYHVREAPTETSHTVVS